MTSRLIPTPAVRRLHRRRPPEWRQIRFPKRGISRLLAGGDGPRPMRQRAHDLWDHVRLTVRSRLVWALLSTWLLASGNWLLAACALLFTLAAVLFPPRIRELRMRLDCDFRTDSAEFLSTVAGSSGAPFVGGNRVTLLNNGCRFYPSMLEAVGPAKHSITMEQYMWAAGSVGLEFAHAFAARARAGVAVKLLVDAVGGASLNREIVQILKESGCELRFFHPVRWYRLHRLNNRTHRKSLVLDGRVGFTGGAGIDDHWLGDARNPLEWRDLQIRLEGPGVIPLQTGFAANWIETTGEVLTGPRYFPPLEATGGVEVQTILSSPKSGQYTASLVYTLALLSARRSILIANPYFVPGPATIDLLAAAVERGVTVRVLVAGPHCDAWFARMNSVRLYGRLLECGVRLYEYQPTMLHQKTMIVDDIWATVGTANFDNRSFQFNEESNVCFYEPGLVGQMREIFEADLKQATLVDAVSWTRRNRWTRYGELFAALLKDQV